MTEATAVPAEEFDFDANDAESGGVCWLTLKDDAFPDWDGDNKTKKALKFGAAVNPFHFAKAFAFEGRFKSTSMAKVTPLNKHRKTLFNECFGKVEQHFQEAFGWILDYPRATKGKCEKFGLSQVNKRTGTCFVPLYCKPCADQQNLCICAAGYCVCTKQILNNEQQEIAEIKIKLLFPHPKDCSGKTKLLPTDSSLSFLEKYRNYGGNYKNRY